MPQKRKSLTFGQAQNEAVHRLVFDASAGAPAEEEVRAVDRPVREAPAPEPDPAPAAEEPATSRLGISVSAGQMEEVRQAYYLDLDHRKDPAPSMARWMVRAIQGYLRLTPERRGHHAERLEGAMAGRKVPYSIAVPPSLKEDLAEAVRAERAVGRYVQVSALVREAFALEAERSRYRARL